MAPMLPLFVYGTLKPGFRNYTPYLAGRTTREQTATVTGAALYTHGPYPFLVLGAGLAAPDDQVTGTLVTLRPTVYFQAMHYIDDLEDYTPGDPNNPYERVSLEVYTDAGVVQAWTYIATERILKAARAGRLHKVAGGEWERDDLSPGVRWPGSLQLG